MPVLIYQQDLVRELVEALNSSTLIVNTNIDTSYNLTSNISFIQDTSSNYIYNLATIENGEGYRWEILSPNWFTVYNQYREVTSQNTDSLSWNKFQNNSLNSITIDVYRSPQGQLFQPRVEIVDSTKSTNTVTIKTEIANRIASGTPLGCQYGETTDKYTISYHTPSKFSLVQLLLNY